MLNRDFREFLELLNEFRVKYLIVGGYALNLYIAKPRNTGDINVWIKRSIPNANKMKKAVEIFCGESGIDKSIFLNKSLRAPIGEPPFCIDILMDIKGLEFDSSYQRKNVIVWNDIKIPFLSRLDLIKTKKAVNRPQDKADLAALGAKPSIKLIRKD